MLDSSFTYYGVFMNFIEILITIWKLLYVFQVKNIRPLFTINLKKEKKRAPVFFTKKPFS